MGAIDYAPCEAAIEPAYLQFQDGVAKMHSQNVTGAVADFAGGLGTLAKALDNDSCGLKNLAAVLSKIAPKLANAIIKDNTVIVEYADVVAFGMAVGRMLQSLRASSCKTKFCVVLQGILGTLQLESADFAQCSSDADDAWTDLQGAVTHFEDKLYESGVDLLASEIGDVASILIQGADVTDMLAK